jgi:hypothetical protein
MGCLLAILPGSDYLLAAYYRAPGKEHTEYMNLAETLNRTATKGRPVVVGDHPYFYTVAPGAQALCIPQSGDDYLLAYMSKYGAPYVLLSEREFWRPAWKNEAALPAGLRVPKKTGDYHLYELDPASRSF